MDLTHLTLQELRNLEKQVSKAIAAGADKEIAAARAKIAEIARLAGISLSDLVDRKPKAPAKPRSAARLQHPSNSSLTWSGRGRPPRWVAELRAAGGQPVEM